MTKNALVPACATGLTDVSTRMIASSQDHTVLVTAHGDVYLAGSKLHGKAGVKANTKNIAKFTMTHISGSKRIRFVACNDYVTLCLTENHEVLQMGGPLGFEAKPVQSLAGLTIT